MICKSFPLPLNHINESGLGDVLYPKSAGSFLPADYSQQGRSLHQAIRKFHRVNLLKNTYCYD
ncbi:hypothetical protein BFAG_00678 [Bacteroides fragilis 3_1_12]|uniref:Uncharacterized protein n=1 Tax=Bacteroides fragilis 3_1_12 TaxID=457424 RepID=A0ABN0BGB0_BACFG|nr:hypothetical protein BFAG_00678 [Bacteroides fragilis 3_1_12]